MASLTTAFPMFGGYMSGADTASLSYEAEWLDVVKQRIQDSKLPDGYSDDESGRWLRPAVGAAAIVFFERFSTALPGEPYLYASSNGDLVAEFAGTHGKMTCIISPDFVYVFAALGDEPVGGKFNLSDTTGLQSHLQNMAGRLR